ncbi:MAG: SDR family oxidoreductase [Thermoguttaceae bacterium]|jgi:nucleoside-diphosphate-sugar epimerase|nr:SDR family oxidoreductase [Thermoguttaceae bacterium]
MRILVAGGAGYVGSVLVPVLLDHGYQVDVIDLLWFGNRLPPEVRVVRQNLFDCEVDDFRGYDQVVFLAGLSNDPMAEFSPSMNFIHNAALPSYLAYTAKKAGVRRFIYASSCSVYGYTVNELYDEDSPVTCGYPYGISKLQGERGVMQLGDDRFSTIALRQGTVCGYSPRMRFDLIVNTMFKSAMTEGTITINNPSIWRPIIDVRDTSRAFLRAVQADQSIRGVFNVACGNFTVGQIGDMVKDQVEALTGRKIRIAMKNVQDFRNYKVTCQRAQNVLGFLPRHSISDIIDSLYAHRDEFGDYSAAEFYNIVVFRSRFAEEQALPALRKAA